MNKFIGQDKPVVGMVVTYSGFFLFPYEYNIIINFNSRARIAALKKLLFTYA